MAAAPDNSGVRFASGKGANAAELVALFRQVFTASEGDAEGQAVATLAEGLLSSTPDADLRVFCARAQDGLAGCICFSRMVYPDDDRAVFLLSPVAVASSEQGKGVGTGLIEHGLEALRAEGVDLAATYGDPSYYGRFGFVAADVAALPAPHPLTHPHGWLRLPLTDRGAGRFSGGARVAPAMNVPDVW